MNRGTSILIAAIFILIPFTGRGEEKDGFQTEAPQSGLNQGLRLKSNLLPWLIAIPNLGLEYEVADKWSLALEGWFCPWKLSKRYSVKTVALLPEARYWIRSNKKGSFFNLHFDIAWYNVRANNYRYQDVSYPLFGGGIGYGYRVEINQRWGFEFEIGAGVANTKYDRYYNIPNGALKDTRKTIYWGIDRAAISVTYFLCDL